MCSIDGLLLRRDKDGGTTSLGFWLVQSFATVCGAGEVGGVENMSTLKPGEMRLPGMLGIVVEGKSGDGENGKAAYG
jgi:hypothetical protein